MTDDDLARAYFAGVAAAVASGTSAEAEAQLTVPVANLLEGLAVVHGIGTMRLLREAQLPGVRPDFAVVIDGRACGWVELKAPGHPLTGESWVGREKEQWGRLAKLDALIVCDGASALLYRSGQVEGEAAPLPYDGPDGWSSTALVNLLRVMATCRPATITSASQLATTLAPLAQMLRDRIAAGLNPATPSEPVRQARDAWARYVHEHVSDPDFADDLAQVISYSLAIAALRGAKGEGSHPITLAAARSSLAQSNAVLSAALGPVVDIEGLSTVLAAEVGAIERFVSAVDAKRVARSTDSRGEPWLWFYEDFLQTYDPAKRKQGGVYYTPTAVVDLQVRLIDTILREHLDRPLSFGAPDVVTLDPATGSGTYPLAVIDRAAAVAQEQRGPGGPAQVARHLEKNLIAFEILPGPFAVAQLRIGQRLTEIGELLLANPHVRVYLTDTLEDPNIGPTALNLWGDMAVLTRERERAAQVKSTQPVTVVLGNPPYKRRKAGAGGGWVLHRAAGEGKAIFDDVLQAAKDGGVKFSAHASLYNDYLYFWRWAIHKAFQQDRSAAVVSFVTASSWLRGPVFLGLRALARELADEVWVVDLGGEGRGALTDDNVFAIQTPVAVVTLFRRGASRSTPATVHYRRISGTRREKTDALAAVHAPDVDPVGWQEVAGSAGDPFQPLTGDPTWQAMPALIDLFPWQQPGAMLGRAWPIAPDPEVLRQRWEALMARSTSQRRAEAFVTAGSGRTIATSVNGMPPLEHLPADAPPPPLARYGYRSFDRQWTFQDPRVAALERPALWTSLSKRQVFLTTLTTSPLGPGPALTVTTAVPDKHHFRGSYGGKDVIPLYRDSAGAQPNVTAGLLDLLTERYGFPVTPEDLAAYAMALLAHPGYHQRFTIALSDPGPRVPVTAEAALFTRASDLGAQLLWLQTYTERFADPARGRAGRLPTVPELGWAIPVGQLPQTTQEISHDGGTRLSIGTGVVTGVRQDVWKFSVSGLAVLPKWLGSRTATGIGRAASRPTPLDLIRPTTWLDEWNDELLDLIRVLTATIDLQGQQSALLDEIMTAERISADELPEPTPAQRKDPRT